MVSAGTLGSYGRFKLVPFAVFLQKLQKQELKIIRMNVLTKKIRKIFFGF